MYKRHYLFAQRETQESNLIAFIALWVEKPFFSLFGQLRVVYLAVLVYAQ